MDEYFKLNWSSLVEETLRRRKEEKINQKEHAALSNVSVPTLASFERGELSLSLEKAFDIMRVFGMIMEVKPKTKHDLFCERKFNEWINHHDISHGYVQIDSFHGSDELIYIYTFKEDFRETFNANVVLDISTIIRELHDYLLNMKNQSQFNIRIIARGLKNRFLCNLSMPHVHELDYFKGRNITHDEIYIEKSYDSDSDNALTELIRMFFSHFGIDNFPEMVISRVVEQYRLKLR